MNSRHFAFDSPVLVARVCACVSMCMCVRPRTRAHPPIYALVYYSRPRTKFLSSTAVISTLFFLDRESRTGSLRVYFSLSISFVNVINVIVRHRYFPPRSDGIFIGTRKGNEARIVSRFSFSPHDRLRQKGEKIAEHEDTNNIYEATGCYVERVLIKLVSRARNNRT